MLNLKCFAGAVLSGEAGFEFLKMTVKLQNNMRTERACRIKRIECICWILHVSRVPRLIIRLVVLHSGFVFDSSAFLIELCELKSIHSKNPTLLDPVQPLCSADHSIYII